MSEAAEPNWTHNGWFGLCPVKIANPWDGCPALAARWFWLEWWFDAQEMMQAASIFLLTMANPHYEPQWAIRVTGERKP